MNAKDTARSEHSPFMKLPKELRLMIYERVIQDAIAASMSNFHGTGTSTQRHVYLGETALLHTNRTIRKESGDVMFRIVRRLQEELVEWLETIPEAHLATTPEMHQKIDDKIYEAGVQLFSVGALGDALEMVVEPGFQPGPYRH